MSAEHKVTIPSEREGTSMCTAICPSDGASKSCRFVSYFLRKPPFCVSVSLCAGNGAASSVLAEAKASRTTTTWFSTPFGKVRAVSTPWGTGMKTSSKFSCPKPDQVLGSFGPIVLLTDDEYEASEWHDYGVAWSDTLTAVPKCRGRAQLDDWGALVNTASSESGERNNLRLHRAFAQSASSSTSAPVNQQASSSAAPVHGLLLLLLPAAAAAAATAAAGSAASVESAEQKHSSPPPPSGSCRVLRSQMRLSEDAAKETLLPVIQLVSTRAIGGNEMLLVDYGREYSRALKQKRADSKRLVNKLKKLKARRPFFQRLVCRRRQIVHFARDCTGVAKP
jgi:hypothetical protein